MSSKTLQVVEVLAGLGFSFAGIDPILSAVMGEVSPTPTIPFADSFTSTQRAAIFSNVNLPTPIPALSAPNAGGLEFIYYVLLTFGVVLLVHAAWSFLKKI